jgi:putative membrane protein
MMDGGGSWWGWTLMSVMMVGFWALVIWAVVAFVGSLRRGESRPTGDLDPQQILANRFARGEIDAEEYHRRLETLRAPEHGGPPVAAGRR